MEILATLLNLFLLTFVVSSMLAMGLGLTIAQIVAPLKNGRLVAAALLANFVLIPLLAFGLIKLFQLETGLATGLIIVSVVAGAPFLPKLAEAAKGDAPFSVGLMVLLMLVTIVYAPIVIPLAIPGATASVWSIAQPLIFMMLLPLGIGLFVKARYEETAVSLQPTFSQASSISLIFMAVLMLIVNGEALIGALGTMAFVIAFLFTAIAFLISYFLGGKDAGSKAVIGLGTAQRNLGAAFAIALSNFADDLNVIAMITVVAVVGLLVLMLTAGELGKRAE